MTESLPENVAISSVPVAPPKSTRPDDLLKMYDEEPKVQAKEISDEAEKAVKVKEEIPKVEAAKSLASAVNSKQGSAGTSKAAPEGSPEAPKEEASPEPEEPKSEQSVTEPDENTEFTRSVKGFDIKFKLKDAVNAFIKQEEFERKQDQRIGYVKNLEQKFKQEYDQATQKFAGFVKAVTEGDLWQAANAAMAVAHANNPATNMVELQRKLLDNVEKFYNAYHPLTAEQRNAFFDKKLAEFLHREVQTRDQRDTAAREQQEAQAYITTLCEQNGTTTEEFNEVFKNLWEAYKPEGKHTQLTPDDVIAQINLTRAYEKAYTAAKAVQLDREDIIDELAKMAIDKPDWNPDTLIEVIKKSGVLTNAPQSVVENLNRKVEKNGSHQSVNSTPKNKEEPGYDKDTLDDLYRKAPRVFKRPW